ncbi:hypothetical protein [Paenibacillus hexagrammi]|uniref:Uncharacterized protein n=1 Tax=Paenibacillus hexagrammi TaxID=2908839 RepID=A0ABY3SPZ9_9BACL|nr:hypothetical protein [Paenibacillus sp. YPD9-1]UJF35764.1 hypothetical protein L0M14_12140 [Paenibacillus sp. YPD9-1]
MKLLKVVTSAALSSAMLLTIASGAFAQASSPATKEASDVSVTLDGKTTTFSSTEIDKLAAQNNVDANALRKAIESGPDEEG